MLTNTIIVIDDQALLLNHVERILRPHFSVLTFSSVEQALPNLEEATLILSDFQMPGLGGAGLIEHLQNTKLQHHLLIMSGLGQNAPELARARKLGIPILAKPFTPKELLYAVRALL